MKKIYKKNSRTNTNRENSIEVERKKNIVLIESAIEQLTEEEIRELFNKIAQENREMKETYYSLDASIAKTKERTFVDLAKKFFDRIETKMDSKFEHGLLKYKRG